MALEKKFSLVVVDDDQRVRKFLEGLLASESYAVHMAASGEAAMDLIYQVQPELVVSDVMMPDMDGLELLKTLKANPQTRHIGFIFLSGRNATDDRVAGLDLGADDYIVKPFSTQELLSRIRAVLRRVTSKNRGRGRLQICSVNKELSSAELFTKTELLLAGQLSAFSLIDLLQSIAANGLSGKLEICSSDHGFLELQNGQVFHAEVQTPRRTIRGMKAWLRLACWTQGLIEFLVPGPFDDPPEKTINAPLGHLVMDAAYYRDEVLRVTSQFPPIAFELLQQQLPPPNAEPIDFKVWENVGNGSSLEKLLDSLEEPDLEILRSAFQQMVGGYLALKLMAG